MAAFVAASRKAADKTDDHDRDRWDEDDNTGAAQCDLPDLSGVR